MLYYIYELQQNIISVLLKMVCSNAIKQLDTTNGKHHLQATEQLKNVLLV